jgi:hypothetical protein
MQGTCMALKGLDKVCRHISDSPACPRVWGKVCSVRTGNQRVPKRCAGHVVCVRPSVEIVVDCGVYEVECILFCGFTVTPNTLPFPLLLLLLVS